MNSHSLVVATCLAIRSETAMPFASGHFRRLRVHRRGAKRTDAGRQLASWSPVLFRQLSKVARPAGCTRNHSIMRQSLAKCTGARGSTRFEQNDQRKQLSPHLELASLRFARSEMIRNSNRNLDTPIYCRYAHCARRINPELVGTPPDSFLSPFIRLITP